MQQVREPIFNVPGLVLALVLAMGVIHGLREWWWGPVALIWDYSLIPARIGLLWGADPIPVLLESVSRDPGNMLTVQQLGLAREILAEGQSKPWTLVTYAVLHGSWGHYLLNSVWLVAFGTPVARRFGAMRFLALLILAALGGAGAHLLTHSGDVMPMIGASAAVSGAMAASIRFVFQPGAPLGLYRLDEGIAYRLPALPLVLALQDRRVLTFVLVWFLLNFGTGLLGDSLGIGGGDIAWEAHVGGFLVGLLAFPWLDPTLAGDPHRWP